MWGGRSNFVAIFLLNCSAGGRGHWRGVRPDSMESQGRGERKRGEGLKEQRRGGRKLEKEEREGEGESEEMRDEERG